MTPYWKEIVSLYAEEMEGKFGGLAVVEKALLPMGLVGLWKGRKGRWEGLGIRAGQEGVEGSRCLLGLDLVVCKR